MQNAFFNVIDVTGLLFSIFYILTALAAIIYYRRRVASSAFDFVTVGLLPLGAAGFLGWIFVKSLGEAPWSQRWSLIAIVIAGLVLLLAAPVHPALPVLPAPEGERGASMKAVLFYESAGRPGGEGAPARRPGTPGPAGASSPTAASCS